MERKIERKKYYFLHISMHKEKGIRNFVRVSVGALLARVADTRFPAATNPSTRPRLMRRSHRCWPRLRGRSDISTRERRKRKEKEEKAQVWWGCCCVLGVLVLVEWAMAGCEGRLGQAEIEAGYDVIRCDEGIR